MAQRLPWKYWATAIILVKTPSFRKAREIGCRGLARFAAANLAPLRLGTKVQA
jgi:hypothetical protein